MQTHAGSKTSNMIAIISNVGWKVRCGVGNIVMVVYTDEIKHHSFAHKFASVGRTNSP